MKPLVLEDRQLKLECDCSRQRMLMALLTMGEVELLGLASEGHSIPMDCHFCGRHEDFEPAELKALISQNKNNDKEKPNAI